ncbi:uncharacterized protein LOC135334461 isoform X3 [Halichondria panicea]|uniref:uncharacterized protein LOC135334461 isoform X3 n=1 Tax=Halichondria panicea TaxID=6063 RepID=UPI00312BB493
MAASSVFGGKSFLFAEFHFLLAQHLVQWGIQPRKLCRLLDRHLSRNGSGKHYSLSESLQKNARKKTQDPVLLNAYFVNRWAHQIQPDSEKLAQVFNSCDAKIRSNISELCEANSLDFSRTKCDEIPKLQISKEGKLFSFCAKHDMTDYSQYRQYGIKQNRPWCFYYKFKDTSKSSKKTKAKSTSVSMLMAAPDVHTSQRLSIARFARKVLRKFTLNFRITQQENAVERFAIRLLDKANIVAFNDGRETVLLKDIWAALHVESSDTFEIVDCNSSTKQKDSAKCGVPEINHTCDSGTESSVVSRKEFEELPNRDCDDSDDDIEETFRKVKPPMIGKVHVPFYADKANLTSSSSCSKVKRGCELPKRLRKRKRRLVTSSDCEESDVDSENSVPSTYSIGTCSSDYQCHVKKRRNKQPLSIIENKNVAAAPVHKSQGVSIATRKFLQKPRLDLRRIYSFLQEVVKRVLYKANIVTACGPRAVPNDCPLHNQTEVCSKSGVLGINHDVADGGTESSDDDIEKAFRKVRPPMIVKIYADKVNLKNCSKVKGGHKLPSRLGRRKQRSSSDYCEDRQKRVPSTSSSLLRKGRRLVSSSDDEDFDLTSPKRPLIVYSDSEESNMGNENLVPFIYSRSVNEKKICTTAERFDCSLDMMDTC